MTTFEEVTAAQTAAQTALGTAGEVEAGGATIGDILKDKATEAYGASQDIIGQLDVASQGYLGAPQVAREKYQDIFNPFARENLIQQYTSNQALPMMGLQSVLGQRFGSIGDIIEKGTGAYQAQTTAAQNQAQLARQRANDLFQQYQLQQAQGQQDWQRGITEQQLEYDINKPYYKPDSGGDGGLTDLLSIIFGQQQEYIPDEPMPTGTPSERQQQKADIIRSPQGEWAFDVSTQAWYPIV